MKIVKNSRNVLTISLDEISSGWEKWFFISSDRHHDSIYSDAKLVKKHMDMIVERDAHILDFGDFFDAMQGKYDPRKNYPEMKPEYLSKMLAEGRGYFDVIVDDAASFYAPYADRFLVIGRGNHEMGVYKHNDVDLIGNLVREMNKPENGGGSVASGGYGGWVRFIFHSNKTRVQSIFLKYFHGNGGAAPVTKGTIQANRQSVYQPDAHIIVNGHIHESWVLEYKRERLSQKGIVYSDVLTHLRVPGYKEEYGDGYAGFHIERGAPPKLVGGAWLKFYYTSDRSQKIKYQVMMETE
jgi:hypothetical protein